MSDAQQKLEAIKRLLLADLDATSDEELRRELIEDGECPEKVAEGMRVSLDTLIRKFQSAHGVAVVPNRAACEVGRDASKCWRQPCADAGQCTAPASGVRVPYGAQHQHFDDARIRNIVNAITAAAWHHRNESSPREMQRAVEQVATPFLKHPEAAHGWVRVPYQHIANLLNLIDPAPTHVDGKTYVFKNPMAAEVLTRLSAEVRAMVDAMKGPQDG